MAAGGGLIIFLVVVPVLGQGPRAAWGQFENWWGGYISPYVMGGEVFSKQINQSLLEKQKMKLALLI